MLDFWCVGCVAEMGVEKLGRGLYFIDKIDENRIFCFYS